MSERIINLNPDEELVIRRIGKSEYSVKEFCEVAKISRSKLYRLISDGTIIKSSDKPVRFNKSELEKIKK